MWLRLYTEILNDPKVQRLPGDTFKLWVNLLCVAKEFNRGGLLPSAEDLSFALRMSVEKLLKGAELLVLAGLLDADGPDVRIHGWSSRQYVSDSDPTALSRKQRQRERQNVTRDTTVTSRTSHANVTRTETETETETEQKEDTPAEPALLPASSKPSKHQHGEHKNVLLADDELARLTETFGADKTTAAVAFLSDYIAMKGYKAKSHYLALRKWVYVAVEEERVKALALERKRGFVEPQETPRQIEAAKVIRGKTDAEIMAEREALADDIEMTGADFVRNARRMVTA